MKNHRLDIHELSPAEITSAFPQETKEIAPRELKRWKAIRSRIWKDLIMPYLRRVKKENRAIMRKILAALYGPELMSINQHIKRLAMTINMANYYPEKRNKQVAIEEARSYPLPDLCQELGIELRQVGSRWLGRCPFHDDRHPSFNVFEDGHFRCWGCGESGDSIDLVQKLKGLDFRETVQYLSGRE